MSGKKVFVTGGAGFIGSRLCLQVLQRGDSVTAFDNLSLGRREYLRPCEKFPNFSFVEADLLDLTRVKKEIAGSDVVFHLAANSDISAGGDRTDLDLHQGTIATYNVCEAMRKTGVKEIVFSSTSAIYGEATVKPTPESYGPLLPISFYGASKLACEALLTAFAHNYDFHVWIYRFANIVGFPSTHGAIHDFVQRLRKESSVLKVLGNGTQKKSYLHVEDCVNGILYGYDKQRRSSVSIWNLASDGVTEVKWLASEVARQFAEKEKLPRPPKLEFGVEDRGWRGDVPFTWLDGARFKADGWNATLDSNASVARAIDEVIRHTRGDLTL